MVERIKVFGPPGCGKTTKLMDDKHGYQYLISRGYSSEEITLITYRKSAANDLIEKVHKITGENKARIKRHVSTIHSICFRLLRENGIILAKYVEKGLHVINDEDKYNFAIEKGYSHCFDVNKPKKKSKKENIDQNEVRDNEEDEIDAANDEPECTYDMFKLYNWCRSTCTSFNDWQTYPGYADILLSHDEVMKFFNDWDEYKASINKVDFSDMIELVLKYNIWLDTPVLMVDEFQDLTAQMYKLFQYWSTWSEYVIVAGDPNQSIYGYDGGSPKYYFDFDADEIILQKTHRLPVQIKNFCNTLFENEGMPPTPTKYAKDGLGEVIIPLRWNEEYATHDTELHLVRCNYQIPAIANQLIKQGKVFSVQSRRNWYYEWTRDEVNLANAIISIRNMRPVTEEYVVAIIKYFSSEVLEITGYGKNEKEQKAAYMATILKDYPSNGIIYYTQFQSGNGVLNSKVIESIYSDSPTAEISSGGEILQSKIKCILNRTELINWDEVKNRRIMTIHGAKGLEADAVFLHTGITKAIYNSMRDDGVEAEVRVWNVGVSRAGEVLYIIKDKGRNFSLPDIYNIPMEDYIIESIEETEKVIKRAQIMSDW